MNSTFVLQCIGFLMLLWLLVNLAFVMVNSYAGRCIKIHEPYPLTGSLGYAMLFVGRRRADDK
jgi:hypothetical protein